MSHVMSNSQWSASWALKVVMAVFYRELKLYPWPVVLVIKRFMCQIEHREEVKGNSENLVLKLRIKSEILSVFKQW